MSWIVKLDIIACDGRGVCAELLPERIDLDDWGYPIIDATPVKGPALEHAKRAIAACPVLALRLERAAKA
jgi:ferredoxin